MRKIFLLLLVLAAWLPGYRAQAQLNKAYFFYAGRSFLIESKYRDAIEVLNFLRGIAKYNLDDLIGADQDFSEAIRKNPVFTTAFQYRAITRMRMGNYDDALRDFQEAIDLRPDLPGPYYSRGVTYLLSQQFEKAIEDFNTFIRYDNKVSDAYINRGTSYLYLKDTTRALEDYNTAIRTNYFDPAGYNRRGALYMAQKKYDLRFDLRSLLFPPGYGLLEHEASGAGDRGLFAGHRARLDQCADLFQPGDPAHADRRL